MVSKGEWKDYAIYISKNIVGFDIYRKATEKPLYQIIKNLKPKKNQKFTVKDQFGKIIKYSDQLSAVLNIIQKKNIKLVK
jgi:hypothetical protein